MSTWRNGEGNGIPMCVHFFQVKCWRMCRGSRSTFPKSLKWKIWRCIVGQDDHWQVRWQAWAFQLCTLFDSGSHRYLARSSAERDSDACGDVCKRPQPVISALMVPKASLYCSSPIHENNKITFSARPTRLAT